MIFVENNAFFYNVYFIHQANHNRDGVVDQEEEEEGYHCHRD